MLRRSPLCRGLSTEELRSIADAVRPIRIGGGQTLYQQDDRGSTMYFVARGRIRLSSMRAGEPFRLLDYLGRGDHFGEMALLTDGQRTATATAVIDSELLELGREQFDQLLASVPGFAANLSRSLGFQLRWQSGRERRRLSPTVVAIVHSTLRTQGLIRPLCEALTDRGERVHVLTDRSEAWPTDGEYLVERIPGDVEGYDRFAAIRDRIHDVMEHQDRVLVDLLPKGVVEELPRILAVCEEVWWLSEPRYWDSVSKSLTTVLTAHPTLASRFRVIWIQHESERFAPQVPDQWKLCRPDFKVVLVGHADRPTRHQRQSIARLVRHLRGTRVGLALGGGGARGLAHLGVLRALEREGIFFDLVAGTSSGALLGVSYAGGWSPQEAIVEFRQALTPPWILRKVPAGSRLYMTAMFRFNAWDAKLRPFLGQATLEQLRIPFYTVAVDLVTGQTVVREQGDAVHAVLESINLPVISRPILRDGMALVDGGILNNLPADVLVERGANFVVGIDVASRLRQSFAGNTPGMSTEAMRRPGTIETLLRVNEVQDLSVSLLRTAAVDLLITPDTSAFEFADFTRTAELADIGETAAKAVLPQLKQMLAELEGGPPRAW